MFPRQCCLLVMFLLHKLLAVPRPVYVVCVRTLYMYVRAWKLERKIQFVLHKNNRNQNKFFSFVLRNEYSLIRRLIRNYYDEFQANSSYLQFLFSLPHALLILFSLFFEIFARLFSSTHTHTPRTYGSHQIFFVSRNIGFSYCFIYMSTNEW